jgi:hypothetical protein
VPWLVGGLVLLLAALLFARWFVRADPKTLVRVVQWLGGGLLAIGGLYLVLTGRAAFAAPLALFLLPYVRRYWRTAFGRTRPSPGQTSAVTTAYLEMTLDHDSGTMTGRVLKGAYSGRGLAELSRADLDALLAECRSADPESVPLLEAFIERAFGPAAGGEGADAPGPPRSATAMTREEALEILGLAATCTVDEIRDAHRRLMLKIHPDKGGSTYLAAKINQAKEVLLSGDGNLASP